MKMTKTILSAFLLPLLLLAGGRSFAQSRDEKAVAAAVEELRKVLVDPDKPIMDRLTAEDLSYGHSDGKIQDKATFIDMLVSGKLDFVDMTLTEQTIKISGNTAIVRHHLLANTNDYGKPGMAKLSVLQVWQKQKKEWKLLARQAVKI